MLYLSACENLPPTHLVWALGTPGGAREPFRFVRVPGARVRTQVD